MASQASPIFEEHPSKPGWAGSWTDHSPGNGMALAKRQILFNQFRNLISHDASIKWFLSTQFTHKIVNLFFAIPCHKIKLTGVWLNRRERNHLINAVCETIWVTRPFYLESHRLWRSSRRARPHLTQCIYMKMGFDLQTHGVERRPPAVERMRHTWDSQCQIMGQPWIIQRKGRNLIW